MDKIKTDIVIIGAGTAGYNAFREARKWTDKVKLVNSGHWGTTCAMSGCMPSKLIIAAADNAHQFKVSQKYGVNLGEPKIDKEAVMSWMHEYRTKWAFGLHDRATMVSDNEYYKNAIRGNAVWEDDNTILVQLDTAHRQYIEFKSAIIATGSSPFIPENLKFKKTITTDTIFIEKELPESLAIVGAGVIALELGQALSRLGVRVEFFTRNGKVGRFSDPVIERTASSIFKHYLPIHTTPDMNEDTFNGFEKVLVAAGRKPNEVKNMFGSTGLHVKKENRTTSGTNQEHVFIAGDVTGSETLQHEAADEGRIAGKNAGRFISNLPAEKSKLRSPLSIVFTDPQMMAVGNPYSEDYQVGHIDWADQGRSNIMQKAEGITRVYAKDGIFMGAEGIGPDQEHHAHLLAWAHQQKMSINEMLSMPFYHPVTLEGIRTALKGIK